MGTCHSCQSGGSSKEGSGAQELLDVLDAEDEAEREASFSTTTGLNIRNRLAANHLIANAAECRASGFSTSTGLGIRNMMAANHLIPSAQGLQHLEEDFESSIKLPIDLVESLSLDHLEQPWIAAFLSEGVADHEVDSSHNECNTSASVATATRPAPGTLSSAETHAALLTSLIKEIVQTEQAYVHILADLYAVVYALHSEGAWGSELDNVMMQQELAFMRALEAMAAEHRRVLEDMQPVVEWLKGGQQHTDSVVVGKEYRVMPLALWDVMCLAFTQYCSTIGAEYPDYLNRIPMCKAVGKNAEATDTILAVCSDRGCALSFAAMLIRPLQRMVAYKLYLQRASKTIAKWNVELEDSVNKALMDSHSVDYHSSSNSSYVRDSILLHMFSHVTELLKSSLSSIDDAHAAVNQSNTEFASGAKPKVPTKTATKSKNNKAQSLVDHHAFQLH